MIECLMMIHFFYFNVNRLRLISKTSINNKILNKHNFTTIFTILSGSLGLLGNKVWACVGCTSRGRDNCI